ncbi:MAG: DNA polymerase III subunit delta [Nonlabens sp.]|uniref:DNA polymerase III subunit delta n=1 Tax=Nonlabens sp. TaxID=1888209 RepID=UPI003EF9F292
MSDTRKIIEDIKNRKLAPIYFLYGNEPYFIDEISDYIADHVLDEGEKGFNQMVLYGRDIDMGELVENAKRFPMMAEYQVIIVKEAQDLARHWDKFESYAKQPQPTTILVFNYKYKSPDKRKKVFKEMAKNAVFFESKPLYENKVLPWINGHLKGRGYNIEPKAGQMLIEFLGTEIAKIKNELDKLMIIVPAGTMITPQLIEENIGISKDYNNFELRKALGAKDAVKVNRIINYFAENPKDNPLVVTVGQLHSFFIQLLKLHAMTDRNPQNVARQIGVSPFFVQEYFTAAKHYPMKHCSHAIKVIRDIDMKSKGVGTNKAQQHDLLQELTVNIMYP